MGIDDIKESWRQNLFASFKHLTTLNSAAVISLYALLDKIPTDPLWLPLVPIAFTSFLFSLIGALGTMIAMCADELYFLDKKNVTVPDDVSTRSTKVDTVWIVIFWLMAFVSILAFVAGIGCVALFGLRNIGATSS